MFPSRLRELRKQRKLTAKEFGEKFNLAESTISGYETGARKPDMDTIEKFADFFGVSVDYLLGRTDDPTPPQQTSSTNSDIPSWATAKDKRDFKKLLEDDAPLMFDGVPLDDEDKEKILKVMEAIFWDAKKRNKRKPIDE